MIDMNIRKQVIRKMTEARKEILIQYPFYGHLAMSLTLGVEECGTAYTDMRRIVFDPVFALSLSMEQMVFVFLHEVLHCVLNHCIRGRDLNGMLFNIACDIVVNSNILYSMGVEEYEIAGEKVMHLAPDKKEGYFYDAEKVYEMLLEKYDSMDGNLDRLEAERSKTDSHHVWKNIKTESMSSDKWKQAAKHASGLPGAAAGMPPSLREYEKLLNRQSRVSWKDLLLSFIQLYCDKFDYLFHPGDRRFAEYEYVIPAFSSIEEEKVSNIWFAVDTSASITKKQLAIIMDEIYQCTKQMPKMEAMLSFFDTAVTPPVSFTDEESLAECRPYGGGGTDFLRVFQYMKDHMSENLPSALIMMTDGYDTFPPEEAALGVPVLWLIIESPVEAPWGTCVHVEF